jgi:hypothetical protein
MMLSQAITTAIPGKPEGGMTTSALAARSTMISMRTGRCAMTKNGPDLYLARIRKVSHALTLQYNKTIYLLEAPALC